MHNYFSVLIHLTSFEKWYKVALWLEGFNRGKPLSFLDHRIKCGNSLVGVLDLDCLTDGIPDNAYKAVTGDDKKLATQIKKDNKNQCKNPNQLAISYDAIEQLKQILAMRREIYFPIF